MVTFFVLLSQTIVLTKIILSEEDKSLTETYLSRRGEYQCRMCI